MMKVVAVVSLVLIAACGPGIPESDEIKITISPTTGSILVAQTVQFIAGVINSPNRAVAWSLSGAGCGGDACGTVSDDGLFTAPASVSGRLDVTVTATSMADRSKSASAAVTVWQPDQIEWAWISGSDIRFAPGDFGAFRVPAPSNSPPGRRSAEGWLDPAGRLWIFGGESRIDWVGDGNRNDLWMFDPETLEWTWMSGDTDIDRPGVYGIKGVSSPSNVPGARLSARSGSDPAGRLWLFGGQGYDSEGRYNTLNDLWRFDLDTLEWTWVSGSDVIDQPGVYGTMGVSSPSNVPGARGASMSWFDAGGNFWLFGGLGFDSEEHLSFLNDLWRYDTATGEWTWVSGANIISQPGVYGTRNVPDPANIPGARRWSASAIDPLGRLWLFGGHGYFSGTGPGYLNDLWRFDPATRLWTWISGSDGHGQIANYGTKGLPDPANIPGARFDAVAWVDDDGVFWLFGGDGTDDTNHWGTLNDLWKFDPERLEWTWVSGSKTLSQMGVYGTQGQPDANNVPGSRYAALSWHDAQGRLWLFGGSAIDSLGAGGYMNDLWRYIR